MSELNNGDVTDVLESFFFDYAIDDDIDEVNTRELMQQCSDMNKAVNEWHAKAKAFDRIVEQRKKTGVITLGHYAWEIIREYESGEQAAWDIIREGME